MKTMKIELLSDITEDVIGEYKIDQNAIIKSPGKFEGEPLEAPLLWNIVVHGFEDKRFYLQTYDTSEEYALVKWDKDRYYLNESHQGFVTLKDQQQMRAKVKNLPNVTQHAKDVVLPTPKGFEGRNHEN